MSSSRSRRTWIIVLLLLLALLFLLLAKCSREKRAVEATPPAPAVSNAPAPSVRAEAPERQPGAPRPDEKLGEATLKAPAQVVAGAAVAISWAGPANEEDYLTIVAPSADPRHWENYVLVKTGNPASLSAPITAGTYEIRYVAGRSKTVLGKTAITVLAASATLEAAPSALIGSQVKVTWTGPNNANDYITIVAKDAPDERSGAYTLTERGSPLEITAPSTDGTMEIRYVTGQGHRVLARRDLVLTLPSISLSGPAEVTEGNDVTIEWSGPSNPGDYITIVLKKEADGRYGNYATVGKAPTVNVPAPMQPGEAEIRFMTAQGARVVARRGLRILPAHASLEAPESVAPGAAVLVKWQAPKNRGDYVTIVPKGAPEAQVGRYVDVQQKDEGSVVAPAEAGEAEIRYVSGQGRKILARRAIEVK